MPRTLLYKTPAPRDQKCFFCLEDIEIGDGRKAHFGIGNSRPFHKICLAQLLPHIGTITFDSQRNMFLNVICDNVTEGEEVTYVTRRIVMDGGKRMRVLECLINRLPIDEDCLHTFNKMMKRQKEGDGTKRTYVRKEQKEAIQI